VLTMTVTAAVTAASAASAVTAASAASAVTAASASASAASAVTAAHVSSVSAPSRSRVCAIVIRCRALGRLQHGLDSAMALAKDLSGLRLGLCSRFVRSSFMSPSRLWCLLFRRPPDRRPDKRDYVWRGTVTSPQSGSGSATPTHDLQDTP
jgi:hypothetical protein